MTMVRGPERRLNEDGGERSHSDKLEVIELRAQKITGN